MKVCILTANLNNFDNTIKPVEQTVPNDFHCFTDKDFPPITGLSPRLQYRIPKTHGWQMRPGYDVYIWLDGAVSLTRDDCVWWYLSQLGEDDMAFFKHPNRQTIRQEVSHLEDHLSKQKPYITERYKNGLHRQFLDRILDEGYKDDTLFASTAFVYRNNDRVRKALQDWWYEGSRYFTCDQVQLPYIIKKHSLRVKALDQPIYKTGYLSLVSHHR